jgi:hypothetical protein
MSGAAGIAAAKNRRSKSEPSQQPIISCSNVKATAGPSGGKQRLVDPDSLQINGPMHFMQVLQVHEQRLNNMDTKISLVSTPSALPIQSDGLSQIQEQGCDAECNDRLSTLEEKVQMLEEVIMNLQLTLTNVQSFAMETSLAMMKLQNQYSMPATPPPAIEPSTASLVSSTASLVSSTASLVPTGKSGNIQLSIS